MRADCHDKLDKKRRKTKRKLASETSDVLHAFLQFIRRQKNSEGGLECGESSFEVVAFYFCGIDANTCKCTLDRSFREHRRQAASLHYLIEE